MERGALLRREVLNCSFPQTLPLARRKFLEPLERAGPSEYSKRAFRSSRGGVENRAMSGNAVLKGGEDGGHRDSTGAPPSGHSPNIRSVSGQFSGRDT